MTHNFRVMIFDYIGGELWIESFGVFFPYIREAFNVNNKTTSLIFSIMMFFQYSGSLLGTV